MMSPLFDGRSNHSEVRAARDVADRELVFEREVRREANTAGWLAGLLVRGRGEEVYQERAELGLRLRLRLRDREIRRDGKNAIWGMWVATRWSINQAGSEGGSMQPLNHPEESVTSPLPRMH